MSLDFAQIEMSMSKKLAHLYDEREQKQMLYWMIEHITGKKKIELLSEKNWKLDEKYHNAFNSFIDRLAKKEPFQYILGYAPFMEHELKVSSDVLIPRPETEELVCWINESYGRTMPLKVVDVGTGSGCIAIALKDHFVNAEVKALDNSEKALEIVKENCIRTGLDVEIVHLDILSENISDQFDEMLDLVVSNPPYITDSELKNLNFSYEPRSALQVPDKEPLLFYKALLGLSLKKLKDGGKIFVECSEFHALDVLSLFKRGGMRNVELKKDMQGKNRMIRAEK
ncbi:MAG TPA: peptide chain release factor N(5)-glutamine methyltransferase [Bacteroidetes bacterium]|nr:peptide chain release factor N(5)-glutamine methyltransferase [Bacteroidota bacterium]